MQLILNSETDIGIQGKMSTIEQESFDEKFINLAEKVDNETPCIKESTVENLTNDINDSVNKDEDDSENINELNCNKQIENDCDNELPTECIDENASENSDVVEENKDIEESNTISESNDKEQTDDPSVEDENNYKTLNGEEQESKEEIIIETDSKESVTEDLEISLDENNEGNCEEAPTPMETESNSKENQAVENGEVINIPDEKDEECVISKDELVSVENKQENLSSTDSNIIIDKIDIDDNENISLDIDKVEKDEADTNNSSSSKKEVDEVKLSDKEVYSDKCAEEDKNTKEKAENKPSSCTNNKESKRPAIICKLSNTLDILSDEEDETIQKESQTEASPAEKCISIEDDDDIMLIDEESNVKDQKNNTDIIEETKIEIVDKQEPPHINLINIEPVEEKDTLDIKQDCVNVTEEDVKNPKEEDAPTENKSIKKPLLPVNFLKTCKKNLADMTRDELEEFCILKIVESVVDRSNLNEIKSQLKTLSQNIEEYKKKAMLLTKQNRDLQVVLKSVQEEQKKRSDVPITPLKITRSVGMQVFMSDKTAMRRKSTLATNNNQNTAPPTNTPNRVNKSQIQKPQKPQNNGNNTQQIPVPRLVPAVNVANTLKMQSPSANIAAKAPVNANMPNGVRNSPPAQKPEKRPHSKMQQGNSVTVDLTDDEPPPKVLQRNVNPPVRLVSPQNLLAPQRQPFGANISSPRKVYIPISGSQNQVRPGQTIMLKSIAAPGPRQRLPSILPKTNTNNNAVRMTRINNRHPAPLPDSMKQYQPPNWKALPPAPELKLSKVENGIVISWKIDGYQEDNHEEIASYQLYAYQETSSPPNTALWKKIGDVKALPLPMACTLTQFMAGYKYYFAVRAVDIRSRLGPFSAPGSILLLNKM